MPSPRRRLLRPLGCREFRPKRYFSATRCYKPVVNSIDLGARVAVVTGGSGGIGLATVQREVDVTDEASVDAATEEVMERFGRIDILVNAAGITAPKTTMLEASLAEWRRIFEINVMGTFVASRAVGRHMVSADYGRIVN